MQIVIEIDDNVYDLIKHYERSIDIIEEENDTLEITLMRAIIKGTPLPKGHGRLGDLDAVMNDICNSINEMTKIGLAVDGEYLWGKLNDAIDNAQTIIKADTESEERNDG